MTEEYSKEQCIMATMDHIRLVGDKIDVMIRMLQQAKQSHDHSKLKEPELSGFTKATPLLSKGQYGSDAYKEGLSVLEKTGALKHHYETNRHHPENFENGVNGMTLIHVTEMVCDWLASTSRNPGGNILKSIEHKKDSGVIDKQLASILKNTCIQIFAA